MDVKYYINKLEEEKKKKAVRLLSFRDMESYKNVPKEKIELFRSAIPYLQDESYIDAKFIYNNFKVPIFQFVNVQCWDVDGVRALGSIRLYTEARSDWDPPIITTEEEFLRQYNSYNLTGSQRYTRIEMRMDKYADEPSYLYVYYTKDGHMFINGQGSTNIAYKSMDELGDQLARICNYREKYVQEKVNYYQPILRKNYRHVR